MMTDAFETDAFDEIRRLQDQIELLRALIQERDTEIERLRAALNACPCPCFGGYNASRTVRHCIRSGYCGCENNKVLSKDD